jgi:hypothetical protein
MNSQFRSVLISLLILAGIIGLISLSFLNLRLAEKYPGGQDFFALWFGARAWVKEGLSPYSGETASQARAYLIANPAISRETSSSFKVLYPLPALFAALPFGLMDFVTARALWVTLMEVVLIFLAILSLRLVNWQVSPWKGPLLILYGLLAYHSVRALYEGQTSPLSALFVALGLYFILGKQDILAGLFLALSCFKPSMVFLLIPFTLLWAISVRRRELVWSLLITTFVVWLASMVMLPRWPLEWFVNVWDYARNYFRLSSPLSIIADTMPGIRIAVMVFLHASLGIYLLVEWILALGKDERWFMWTAMLTIVISVLVGYGSGTSNYTIMIPVVFLILQAWEQRWQNGGQFLTIILLLLLGGGIWALFLATRQGYAEPLWVYFPLPFICLICLWWIRWWFIRPPRLYLEELARKIA